MGRARGRQGGPELKGKGGISARVWTGAVESGSRASVLVGAALVADSGLALGNGGADLGWRGGHAHGRGRELCSRRLIRGCGSNNVCVSIIRRAAAVAARSATAGGWVLLGPSALAVDGMENVCSDFREMARERVAWADRDLGFRGRLRRRRSLR